MSKPDWPTETLEDMKRTLNDLVKKVDILIQKHEPPYSAGPIIKGNGPLDAITLLSLPAKLRKTAVILSELGEATADEVAKKSQRQRAVESAYLNQLHEKGYIEKKRKSHTVYFSIPRNT